MNNNVYLELVKQTFGFPQENINIDNNHHLLFNNIRMMDLVKKYGTPLKISYLPKISSQIQKAQKLFKDAFKKYKYEANYYYAYCTKSSHFSYVLDEVLKNNVHIETSFDFDINLINKLYQINMVNKKIFILCNGYKQKSYISKIAGLIHSDFKNVIPILDNTNEVISLRQSIKKHFNIGIRVATDEEPSFPFYTSRLGIRPKDILEFYVNEIEGQEKYHLKMLHIFLNKGIKDDVYYWSELNKVVNLYCQLKKICPELDSINLGGGFPIKHSLGFDFDYKSIIYEIIKNIKKICKKNRVPVPHLFTEFGSFTVGESMAHIFKVLEQKNQNESELWYMINSSFITCLPDTWGIGEKFLMLPLNHWDKEYHKVHLGGITCDSHDYYDSEEHINQVFLPKLTPKQDLYIGFFHTGAYQDQISGYGGIKHCLVPSPKHIIVDKDKNGKLIDYVFKKEQTATDMLKILGYK